MNPYREYPPPPPDLLRGGASTKGKGIQPVGIHLASSRSHLQSQGLGYWEKQETGRQHFLTADWCFVSYLELNAFQEVEPVCIHFEIFQELRVWHIVWIIFWEWKVWVTRHLLAAVGNHRLIEAGSAFFNMVLSKQCIHMSVYAFVHVWAHVK